MGKTMTRVASKTSKYTTAWWLAVNWNSMPLVMKCQINNQKSKASPTQIWIALAKLVATYSLTASLLCASIEPGRTMAATSFAVLDSNGSEQFRHLWRLRLAGPVWLPRQAKLPLHGGWYRTGAECHWPWNVKSTIKWGLCLENWWLPRKAKLPLQLGENWYNFATSLFCNAQSVFRTISIRGSWWLSHSCDSCAAVFAAKIWAQMGSIFTPPLPLPPRQKCWLQFAIAVARVSEITENPLYKCNLRS